MSAPPPWEQPTDKYPCGHERSMHYPKKCLLCEGKRNREHVDRLAEVIRDVKRILAGGTDPETERVLLHRLNALMHPDPAELIAILNARRIDAEQNPRRR